MVPAAVVRSTARPARAAARQRLARVSQVKASGLCTQTTKTLSATSRQSVVLLSRACSRRKNNPISEYHVPVGSRAIKLAKSSKARDDKLQLPCDTR